MLYHNLVTFIRGNNFSNVQDIGTLPKEEQVKLVICKDYRNHLKKHSHGLLSRTNTRTNVI